MNERRFLISGGRVVDPEQGLDRVMDLYIGDGHILAMGSCPEAFVPEMEIKARGQVVCPGFIDVCARFREPGFEHKACIAGESEAAAAAGITTACCPPDTWPVIDTPAVAKLIREKAEQSGKLNLLPVGALTRGLKGQDLGEMNALKQAGCIAVSNASAPVANSLILRRAMEYAASHDLLVMVRPEDVFLADEGCVHEGPVSTRLGLRGIPYAAETVAVAQVLALIEHTGARVHFGQLSSARAMRSIARARDKGLPVTADVAIHQLHLTEQAIEGFDARYHVRPPLRCASDRDALREGVRDGIIAAICSDHQPHEPDAKLDAFPATEPGMASLQTLLPLTLNLVDKGVLTLSRAITVLSSGPAGVLGIRAGSLQVGAVADICVFDPSGIWCMDEQSWFSAGLNTPWWGETMTGRVTHTLSRGRLVFRS